MLSLPAAAEPVQESLPSRERGLKSFPDPVKIGPGEVAPLAGAWIEIKNSFPEASGENVAPLAGAWIEIHTIFPKYLLILPSLPSRERGLKSYVTPQMYGAKGVAPLAGAWIEMVISGIEVDCLKPSLPSRERGLKCTKGEMTGAAAMSLPSRERGLKFTVNMPYYEQLYRRSPRGSVD